MLTVSILLDSVDIHAALMSKAAIALWMENLL